MELKITDDKVRDAAKVCRDADKVLRKLFPSAFHDVDTKKFTVATKVDGLEWLVRDEAGSIILCPMDSGESIWCNVNKYEFSYDSMGIHLKKHK